MFDDRDGMNTLACMRVLWTCPPLVIPEVSESGGVQFIVDSLKRTKKMKKARRGNAEGTGEH